MKQIEFAVAGPPEEVVRYAEAEAPAAPGPDDVLIKVLAFPINPADLLTMQGIYPRADLTTPA
jgi:trans-2-enoyl-CoA reductase